MQIDRSLSRPTTNVETVTRGVQMGILRMCLMGVRVMRGEVDLTADDINETLADLGVDTAELPALRSLTSVERRDSSEVCDYPSERVRKYAIPSWRTR